MKPILFNTTMVKAILDGKKTCTRRIIKNKYENADIEFTEFKGEKVLVYAQNDVPEPKVNDDGSKTMRLRWMKEIEPPYEAGDILYVRETWNINPVWVFGGSSDNLPPKESKYIYKAANSKFTGGWKPSIHMPKEAARLFLKVTSVRAERLKDITEQACFNEGIREFTKDGVVKKYDIEPNMHTWQEMPRTPVEAFEKLWNSTVNVKKYWNGWTNLFEYNPWVWVIEFEVENKGGEVNE